MQARYDGIAEQYVSMMGNEATDETACALLELLEPLARCRVLDIACGHGRLSRALARGGASVVGIDISRHLLETAQAIESTNSLGIEYRNEDITTLDVPGSERFDAVACNFGLSDIDDLDGAMAAISHALEPGGVFAFSILHPCFPGWDHDAPSAWPPDGGYFQEGWWLAENTGLRGRVGSNFRMLSTYLNALVQHNLMIDHVVEPMPSDAWLARLPGTAPVPYTLVVRSVRN